MLNHKHPRALRVAASALAVAAFAGCTAPRQQPGHSAATHGEYRTVVVHVDKMMKSRSGAT